MLVAATRATGFVGRRTVDSLLAHGDVVRAPCRSEAGGEALDDRAERFIAGPIHGETDWSGRLDGVDAAVHLAGRVHVLDDRDADPLAAYREVNVAGTLRLARASAEARVCRFVFISSNKVNGETTGVEPFSETSVAAPVDPYGVSKLEAEAAPIGVRNGDGGRGSAAAPRLRARRPGQFPAAVRGCRERAALPGIGSASRTQPPGVEACQCLRRATPNPFSNDEPATSVRGWCSTHRANYITRL
jgi:uncharacterized protein YbjT (DUF2867 family)